MSTRFEVRDLSSPNRKAQRPDLLIAALGLALQRRRQALKISQEEVAKRSGLHRTYISELERRSRNFSVKSYLVLAAALEIKASDLMRLAEEIAAEKDA